LKIFHYILIKEIPDGFTASQFYFKKRKEKKTQNKLILKSFPIKESAPKFVLVNNFAQLPSQMPLLVDDRFSLHIHIKTANINV